MEDRSIQLSWTHVGTLALGLVLLSGFVLVRGGSSDAVEAGRIEPVVAVPAEEVVVRELAWGETFGEVLSSAALDGNEQQALLLAFQEKASPRRMRVGTQVSLRYLRGSEELRGVDVRLNPDSTVRVDRSAFGWASSVVLTPTAIDTVYSTGTIASSLWAAVLEDDRLAAMPRADREELIYRMDQIFQWQVDFSRQIQSGDTYRLAFEREVRPDGSMRNGHVVAAELVNQGRAFQAIWFDPNDDGSGTYYDIEGNSVRRAFLKKPVQFRYISSGFTNARFHPVLKQWRAHRGVDYAAAVGTPVEATGDGVVVHRGQRGSYGNLVEIQHANGFTTRYAHLSRFASGISVGSRVKQGELIGYVGATGMVTGPHLHYEMLRNGTHLDPTSLDLPAGDPVPTDRMDQWRAESSVRMALLDRVGSAMIQRRAEDQDRDESDPDAEVDASSSESDTNPAQRPDPISR